MLGKKQGAKKNKSYHGEKDRKRPRFIKGKVVIKGMGVCKQQKNPIPTEDSQLRECAKKSKANRAGYGGGKGRGNLRCRGGSAV